MNLKPGAFWVGAISASFVWCGILYLPRVVPLRGSNVSLWSREEVERRGLVDLREATAILQRWDIGGIAEKCLTDFRRMALGEACLGPVYEVDSGKRVVLMFSVDRDQWGRSVTEQVIAYVYDTERQELIGKFWVPVA